MQLSIDSAPDSLWKGVCNAALRSAAIAAAALLLAALLTPRPAFGGTITLSIPTIDLPFSTLPQTVLFDLVLTDSSGSGDLFDGYQADVTVADTTHLQFVTADLSTTTTPSNFYGPSAAYPASFDTNAPGLYPTLTPPYNEAYSTNQVGTPPGPALTQTYALMRVGIEVAASAPVGSYAVTLTTFNVNTSPFGNYVLFDAAPTTRVLPTLVNGSIVITAVPEPTSLALALLAAVGVGGGAWARRRRGARAANAESGDSSSVGAGRFLH